MTPTEYRNSSQEKNSKTNIYQPKSNSKSTLLLFIFIRYPFIIKQIRTLILKIKASRKIA